jgi:hypothetical protein
MHADHSGHARGLQPQLINQTSQQRSDAGAGSSSNPKGLRAELSSSSVALATRAYACAPSQSAACRSNNSSTSEHGSILMHSRGSSVQDAPVSNHSHPRAEGVTEPASAITSDPQQVSTTSSVISNVLSGSGTNTTAPEKGERQGWQHADEQRLAPAQHVSQQQVLTTASAASAFPLKLAEITEADRIEKAAQLRTQQSDVVARVLGRLGGNVLSNLDQVRQLRVPSDASTLSLVLEMCMKAVWHP